MVRACAN